MSVTVLLRDTKFQNRGLKRSRILPPDILPSVREMSYVAADSWVKMNYLKLLKDRKTVSVEVVPWMWGAGPSPIIPFSAFFKSIFKVHGPAPQLSDLMTTLTQFKKQRCKRSEVDEKQIGTIKNGDWACKGHFATLLWTQRAVVLEESGLSLALNFVGSDCRTNSGWLCQSRIKLHSGKMSFSCQLCRDRSIPDSNKSFWRNPTQRTHKDYIYTLFVWEAKVRSEYLSFH